VLALVRSCGGSRSKLQNPDRHNEMAEVRRGPDPCQCACLDDAYVGRFAAAARDRRERTQAGSITASLSVPVRTGESFRIIQVAAAVHWQRLSSGPPGRAPSPGSRRPGRAASRSPPATNLNRDLSLG
jgi:hypothetical protein